MSEMKDKLSAKQADVQSRFEGLDKQRQQLISQRADLDRKIASISEELVRLQGENRLIEDLSKDDKKDTPKLEIPKKKK